LLRSTASQCSAKALGRFEVPIIEKVSQFFESQGYTVIPHTTLNLAWRHVLSDVDILVMKGPVVIAVEVKSAHDDLHRASRQLSRILDYVDYALVATDQDVKDWNDDTVGLMLVRAEGVVFVKKGAQLSARPSFKSLFALQKKCLSRMLSIEGHCHLSKYEITKQVDLLGDDDVLRDCVKEIVTCGGQCSTDCPIWNFTRENE
jgi:hypothetical protein